jgi:hypothetical protein
MDKVPTIDIPKYIRTTIDAAGLERHLFDDSGGNGHKSFLNILHRGTVLIEEPFNRIDAGTIQKYGPGLVSVNLAI